MLGDSDLPALMQSFVKLLGSNATVVQSYAAICIDRFLLLRHPDGSPRLPPAALSSLLGEAFNALFTDLAQPGNKENPYLMRAVMRIVNTAKLDIVPVAQTALNAVCNKLAEIYRNPSNPHFTHYLFETMASILDVLIKTQNYEYIEGAEKILMPAFNTIVDEDIVDLAPYMFQIVAQLVEAHKSAPDALVQRYGGLYKKFLMPQWWLRHGNVPALTRLFRAFIQFAPEFVNSQGINPVLGIFQKLVASKTLDKFGMHILTDIIRFMPYVPPCLAPLMTSCVCTYEYNALMISVSKSGMAR
jgi:exportin-2 (importin alpha re-exporter)